MDGPVLEVSDYCRMIGRSAKIAARELAIKPGAARIRALQLLARGLRKNSVRILEANTRDVEAATRAGASSANIDRLRLTSKRISEMARGVEDVAALPDPLGEVVYSCVRPNGLNVQRVRVPLGVIFFIYESRPNVTVDAAALCLASGNAVILRGGKEARHSNRALNRVIQRACDKAGLSGDAVLQVTNYQRSIVGEFLKLNQWIDLVIPRGGEELIRRVSAEATMPVLKHYQGICHVYLDESADLDRSVSIVENSKCQRPGVCNAAETLLVHEKAANRLLPSVARRLLERGVELRGCDKTRSIVPEALAAQEDDFGREFLDLILAVKVVPSLSDALQHIARYGSGHTDAIVTDDLASARAFTAGVDSSAVVVNASTRFNDGGELGLGAEIGISTDKFHARGPCGLKELTSYKYIVQGDGQIRE